MSKNSLNTTLNNEFDFFQSIANTIHQVTSLPVSIWAPDQKIKTLRIVAAVGLPANYVQTASLDLSKPSFTGEAFNKKKIQVAKDIQSDPRWYYKEQAREMNWKSAICVPIEADKRAVGLISVYTYRERSISDLAFILPAFAKQIGRTIEADKQNEVLQRILETGEKLQSMTDSPRDVLNAIVKNACELTGADCTVIYPYDAEHNELFDIQNVASHGIQEPLTLPEKPRAKGGMAAYVERKGEVIVANVNNQSSSLPSASSFIQRESVQAFMGVTLKVTEDVLGVLYVNFRVPHVFTQHEKDTIRLFAHQTANALNNARLYRRISARIEALEKLHEASTSLSSIPAAPEDLKETLMRIAQSAKQVLGADLVELYQYDESRDWYGLPPIQAGEHFDKFVIKDTIHKDDIIWEIVRGKQPVYTANVQESKVLTRPFTVTRDDAPKQRFVIRENIKSSAAIPLMAGAEVVGVLFTNYRTSQVFSLEQTRLIELFASQAAIAIRNTRLFQQLYEYLQLLNDQMQALHAVAQKQNIKEVLEQILIGINTIFGDSTSASINLYNESKNTFEAYQAAGSLKEYLMKVPPRTLGSGGTGRFIIETKDPLYLDDVQKPPKDTPTVRQESIDQGICSFAALPLKRDLHVLGVLFVNSQKPIIFTDGIKGILELFASQAAIAIENNRLYEQRDRNIKDKQALNDLTQKLTENIGVGEKGILELLHQSAGELMDTDNMYVALYDAQTDIVRFGLAFVEGEKVDLAKDERWQPRKAGKGRTEAIIRTKKSILISTEKESKDWYAQPRRKEYTGIPIFASWLGVPMVVGDKVLGVIATYHPTKEYVYSGDDLTILQAMANQAAVALDNARSFAKDQQRIRDQETINSIAQAISMKVGTRDLLQTIVTQIQENLDCTHCAIFLPEKFGDEVALVSEYTQGEFAERIKSRQFKPGEGIAGWVFEHGETVIVPDTLQDGRYVHIREGGRVSRSLMAVPVKMNGETVGVISVDHNSIDSFNEDDCRLVETVAEHVAIAIEKGRAYEEIDKLYQEARSEAIANRQLATLGTAIAALQHRIHNTLNIISPNVTRLRDHLSSKTDPEVEEILGIIDRNTRYTSTLLSRIQTPLQEFGMVNVDVNAILVDIVNRLKKEWAARTQVQVAVDLTLDSNIPVISLPIGQISEVFSNLIDNAYRALDKAYQGMQGGLKIAMIVVDTKLDKDDKIKVQVIDNVPGGIPSAIQEKLFYKPVPSRIPGEGSGLGLWLSKLIMQRIGGEIRIEKTDVGGTTMLVEIPLPKEERG